MKKLFHVALALALGVSAAFADEELEKRVGGLQAQVDHIISKAGIHFGGEFRSQFFNSHLSGDALEEGRKKSESAEYTSVDFDIVARPNNALSARAMFRLHQDWRNFFSDVQNPVSTRWLSVDGAVGGGILSYHVGDYTKKLSPLTLWTHEFELLYEPEIFAAERRFAMSESFLGDSKRLLQGFDLSFKAELYPLLSEVEADAFGARLATRGSIETGVIPPNVGGNVSGTAGGYYMADFDKYLLGFNLGSQIIKGAGFAVSDILIYDYLPTYNGTEDEAKGKDPQSTNVLAFRLNADTRAFMEGDAFNAGVSAEVALSADKIQKTVDTDTTISGMAVNAGFFAKTAFGENNLKLTATYVMNDKEFRNDAVQTPHFIQRQIMNSENHLANRLGVINPFDALYRTVFKYSPSQYMGVKQPYGKYAYNNAILPTGIVASLVADAALNFPNIFQAAGNSGSADRVGPIVKLDGSFLDEAVTVGVRAAMLSANEETTYEYETGDFDGDGYPILGSVPIKQEYLNAGGGASVDIAKFVPVVGPSLKIGGSFMMYNSTTGKFDGDKVNNAESESQLISADINYGFTERFRFLAGYQLLTTNIKSELNGKASPDVGYTFDNLGVGFGYKVADGGDLVLKLTRVSGKTEVGDFSTGYHAMQPEVWLTVKF
ncbi:MAG: hypothetical protein LBH93_07520 [Chitinispirillales bacterium]|jgi:hypothetical protein|nr:hypothetical protein [Chitinispirillales bacterium]